MHRRMLAAIALLLVALVALVPFARARQLRISVANFSFTLGSVTLNQGDHVVWVWTGGFHSVVSGAPGAQDGIFDSGSTGSAQTFSWKADRTGTVNYFCGQHLGSMVGDLTLLSSGATAGLSDFRITEVQYNVAGNADLIEITNLGATGDMGRYRLKISGATVATLPPGAGTSISVPAGGKVVIHVGESGTSTATTIFLNLAAGLPDAAGSVALYVPNTQATLLTDATQILDYVAWGSGTQENEATATSASLWSTSNAVALVASGHSIEFCGQTGQHGVTRWYENPTPNFGGSDNCSTPITPTTWGRLKTLYR